MGSEKPPKQKQMRVAFSVLALHKPTKKTRTTKEKQTRKKLAKIAKPKVHSPAHCEQAKDRKTGWWQDWGSHLRSVQRDGESFPHFFWDVFFCRDKKANPRKKCPVHAVSAFTIKLKLAKHMEAPNYPANRHKTTPRSRDGGATRNRFAKIVNRPQIRLGAIWGKWPSSGSKFSCNWKRNGIWIGCGFTLFYCKFQTRRLFLEPSKVSMISLFLLFKGKYLNLPFK